MNINTLQRRRQLSRKDDVASESAVYEANYSSSPHMAHPIEIIVFQLERPLVPLQSSSPSFFSNQGAYREGPDCRLIHSAKPNDCLNGAPGPKKAIVKKL